MHLEPMKLMTQTNKHLSIRASSSEDQLRLVFLSDQMLLRDALKKTMRFFIDLGFSQDEIGVVEIVLAEALNNVIEHAYQEKSDGLIELAVQTKGDTLHFTILDKGVPMPGGVAPAGKRYDLNVDLMDLPEGGFGWLMIRELTDDLVYKRLGEENHLSFAMSPKRKNQ